MTQLSLSFTPRSNSQTSRHAADEVKARAQAMCARVMAYLAENDGATAGEVAAALGWQRVQAGQRLNDLLNAKPSRVRQGDSRTCEANGRRMVTWWLRKEDE